MRIGEVATAVGIDAQTIRFYERRGLLPQPERDPNGYRSYDSAILVRLQFIRAGQRAGLSLVEIGTILDMRDVGNSPCTHVRDLLSAKLSEVHRRQEELTSLEAELRSLIRRGDRLDPTECTNPQICLIIDHEGMGGMPRAGRVT